MPHSLTDLDRVYSNRSKDQNGTWTTPHKFERVRAQQREAKRQVEHLSQTLLQRAFRGELTETG